MPLIPDPRVFTDAEIAELEAEGVPREVIKEFTTDLNAETRELVREMCADFCTRRYYASEDGKRQRKKEKDDVSD